MNKTFYLAPNDGRKSFYGKAVVIERDGEKLLQSYNTIVCKVDSCGNFKRLWNGWSATTQRHVNAFVDYYGLPQYGGKSAWKKMEPLQFAN